MNLEPIRQSEISQKEKNKYFMLMHVSRIWKDDTAEPTLQDSNGDTDIQKRLVDTQVGKERVESIERAALKHKHYYM